MSETTLESQAQDVHDIAAQQLAAELGVMNPQVAEHLRRKYRAELGPQLCALLDDPDVTDFYKNPHSDVIWVKSFSRGKHRTDLRMSNTRALRFIGTIASAYNAEISPREPRFARTIPFHGARFTAAVPPVAPGGAQWTVRKRAQRVADLSEYVPDGILVQSQIDAIDALIDDRRNILIGGEQGAGKTHIANSIIKRMSDRYPNERFGIIEDNQELMCEAEDRFEWVTANKTNGNVADVTLDELIFDSMRWGATRLCIGEIRSAAGAYLEAMTAGYQGGVATIHGTSPPEVMRRFEILLRRDNFPVERDAISAAIHAIIVIRPYRNSRIVRDIVNVNLGASGAYLFTRSC